MTEDSGDLSIRRRILLVLQGWSSHSYALTIGIKCTLHFLPRDRFPLCFSLFSFAIANKQPALLQGTERS